ncbi:hypothetical protein BRD03_11515 [Halobacteriales archaeon QS_9_68_17]|nr:MAG: hypothetical protein BRD03_11515 [Halobacteriales archaeon QS_9_68_17]
MDLAEPGVVSVGVSSGCAGVDAVVRPLLDVAVTNRQRPGVFERHEHTALVAVDGPIAEVDVLDESG